MILLRLIRTQGAGDVVQPETSFESSGLSDGLFVPSLTGDNLLFLKNENGNEPTI